MHHPNSAERLQAQIIAVRIVVTRLLFELAWQVGDPSEIIPKEHQAAMRDLESYNFRDVSDEQANAMRAYVQRVLDEMFTAWKPPSKPSRCVPRRLWGRADLQSHCDRPVDIPRPRHAPRQARDGTSACQARYPAQRGDQKGFQ